MRDTGLEVLMNGIATVEFTVTGHSVDLFQDHAFN